MLHLGVEGLSRKTGKYEQNVFVSANIFKELWSDPHSRLFLFLLLSPFAYTHKYILIPHTLFFSSYLCYFSAGISFLFSFQMVSCLLYSYSDIGSWLHTAPQNNCFLTLHQNRLNKMVGPLVRTSCLRDIFLSFALCSKPEFGGSVVNLWSCLRDTHKDKPEGDWKT